MSNPASETIMGQYYTMPDGQVMQKLSNGKWVSTVERLEAAEKSITERFEDTTTVPSNWNPQTVVKGINDKPRKERNIEDLIKYSTTHRHLHAYLIERLGSPTEIIKNKALPKSTMGSTVKTYPMLEKDIRKVIEALHCEPWNTVLKIMDGEIK